MKKPTGYKVVFAVFFLYSVLIFDLQSQSNNFILPLIPYPSSIHAGIGTFSITKETTIVSSEKRFDNEVEQLNLLLKQYFGKSLKRNDHYKGPQSIVFKYDPALTAPESYQLDVSSEAIVISAKDGTGIFRAVETIRQLLPANEHNNKKVSTIQVPALSILDQPAFAWRGMHLDVSRHFFSVEYLEKYIDLLALYKFNKLHLHLTDDQGWRIEIKKYPKLTEEGAWRTFNNQDSACMLRAKSDPDFIIDPKHIIHQNGKSLYGGFYTQEQMKGIVAFALARHIDIIPEIDMPGHMMAAITSYPFLTANGENKWGKLFTTPICPCKETTFEFAENVFTEIMDIFPSQYIHIGGDEVDRTSWTQSDSCKMRMNKYNIHATGELQSYFINRMEKFFNAKGRRLIGWDEILEDGISSTAMVMYWRTWVPDAPVKAAKHGNQVIMSPGNPLYFDNQPDANSLSEVYHYNPVPSKLNAAEAKIIIGAQANTWSEMIPTENRAEYLVFPRMTALAEVLWTNNVDYKTYLERLKKHYPRLDALHVNYRLPDIDGLIEQNVFVTKVVFNPEVPLPDLTLRYSTDGSLPDDNSTVLNGPMEINKNCFIRLAAFTKNGRRGDINDLHFNQQDLAVPEHIVNVKDGLLCSFYPREFKNVRSITGNATAVVAVNRIGVPASFNAPSFGLKYRGYLDIPEDGIYSFYLTCDDGGILKIANRNVIDNDGPHAPLEKNGQVALRRGLQSFALDFFEGGGGYTLKLVYRLNGSQPKTIPASWLKYQLSDSSLMHNQIAPKPYGVLPSSRQLKWQETDMYCIIHLTPTTFQNLEWGYGDADPSIFNPSNFSAQQIVDAAKSGGFNGIVIVAKHHDGFALWPTKTSTYNITKSPWKKGNGDLVKEFQMAAKRDGMKFGIYCSPWDRHNPAYGTPDYVSIYRRQLKELYSNYGDLFMSWHDGANGGDGFYGGKNEKRKVDQSTYYDWMNTWEITRKMQPDASIFSDIGLDVRWVGNERGEAPETSWSTIDLKGIHGNPAMPGATQDYNLGTGTRDGKQWVPFEGDVALRPGWFYHPEEDNKLKTTAELFNIYCSSVGRGGALDLGLSPNREGRLHTNDVKALAAFGSFLKETFVHDLAKDATITVSNLRGNMQKEFGTAALTDGDRYSYWATDDEVHQASVTLAFKESVIFNLVQLRENIKLGQRIDSVELEVLKGDQWTKIAKASSIGANRIIRLSEPQKASQVRIQVYAPVCIALSETGLFLEPKISDEKTIHEDNNLMNTGWKVIREDGSSEVDGINAVDQNKSTVYQTSKNSIILDFGKTVTFSGFGYLPAQDNPAGSIEKYELLVSDDAKNWSSIKLGEFSNIRANPILQRIILDRKVSSRYVKLTAIQIVPDEHGKTNLRVSEINIYR